MTEQIDVRTVSKREVFVTPDGRGKLVCSVTLPSFDGHERINEFYCRIADACVDYCGGELFRRYEGERAQGSAWEIKYKLAVSAQMCEERANVSLAVTLSDAFARKTLAKHYETHLWSLEYDRMMPEKKLKKSGV